MERMTMNPWLAGELAESRREEFVRSAQGHRGDAAGEPGAEVAPRAHPRFGLITRPLGSLFISVGRRMAGPDVWAEVLESRHLGLEYGSRGKTTLRSPC
jgi:hypothetical protein